MLDVGGETGIEPADHPLFQGVQFGGRPVAGDDDLFVGLFQGVEGVEKFFFRAFFIATAQELDVVDEEDVDVAVTAAEAIP